MPGSRTARVHGIRAAFLLAAMLLVPRAWAQASTSPLEGTAETEESSAAGPLYDAEPRYFYFGREYGSQSLFGPASVFLNRGYDILQLRPGRRNIFSQSYGEDGKVVLRNLANPFPAIAKDGVGRFFRTEIFPLSFTPDTAFWVPNYSLHLIGGGMTFRALTEWFADQRAPVPWFWSGATLLASALVNETLENRGNTGFNTDAIADVYFFDIGGMILFSFDRVARFFSQEVIVADWSLQPAFTFPGGNLNNQGNNFAVKWPLPFYRRLSPFVHMGLGSLGGVSYRVAGEYSVSVAAGERSYRLTNISLDALDNKVKFAPSAAVFIDRNDSLLASLQVSDIDEYLLQLNVYPNAFYRSRPGIGFFYIVGKSGQFVTGLSVTHTMEFGFGYERPRH